MREGGREVNCTYWNFVEFFLPLSSLTQVTSNLTITSTLFDDRGLYRCVATNIITGGAEITVQSALALLTVSRK